MGFVLELRAKRLMANGCILYNSATSTKKVAKNLPKTYFLRREKA